MAARIDPTTREADAASLTRPHQGGPKLFRIIELLVGMALAGMLGMVLIAQNHQNAAPINSLTRNGGVVVVAPAQPSQVQAPPATTTPYKYVMDTAATTTDLMTQFATAFGVGSYTINQVQIDSVHGLPANTALSAYPGHIWVVITYTAGNSLTTSRASFERIGDHWNMRQL